MITAYVENAARRNVKLKAERSTRKANELAAYIAKRQRERGIAAALDIESDLEERGFVNYQNGAGI